MDIRQARYPHDLAAIAALVQAATEADGTGPFGEASLADLDGLPSSRSFGYLATNERAGGYVHAIGGETSFSAELALHVGHREVSVVASLLAAVAAEAMARGAGRLGLWVHTADVADLVAAVEGWTLGRALHRMEQPLPLEEAPEFAPGIDVRGFRVGRDEPAWLELNNAAFEGHPEQGGWTEADLEQRLGREWFDPEGLRMAWSDGELVAFNWTKLHGDGLGEIYAIASSTEHRGRGLGRAIALDGLWDLSSRQGATRAMLYADAANAAAVTLYEDLGFSTVETHRFYLAELENLRS